MPQTTFAPQLSIPSGVTDISFYTTAFHAIELRRWNNDDGSVHVAELAIDGATFHLHEETPASGLYAPTDAHGTTTVIGLFVSDVHSVMESAIEAGATELSPTTGYEYGYRQGKIKDPFGHQWLIQVKL